MVSPFLMIPSLPTGPCLAYPRNLNAVSKLKENPAILYGLRKILTLGFLWFLYEMGCKLRVIGVSPLPRLALYDGMSSTKDYLPVIWNVNWNSCDCAKLFHSPFLFPAELQVNIVWALPALFCILADYLYKCLHVMLRPWHRVFYTCCNIVRPNEMQTHHYCWAMACTLCHKILLLFLDSTPGDLISPTKPWQLGGSAPNLCLYAQSATLELCSHRFYLQCCLCLLPLMTTWHLWATLGLHHHSSHPRTHHPSRELALVMLTNGSWPMIGSVNTTSRMAPQDITLLCFTQLT